MSTGLNPIRVFTICDNATKATCCRTARAPQSGPELPTGHLRALPAGAGRWADGHHRGLHQRDPDQRGLWVAVAIVGPGDDLGRADRERASRTHDLAGGAEPVAPGRREQVDLELHGQHVPVLGHQARRSVSARRVRERRDRPGVHEAVLLAQVGPVRQVEHHPPDGQFRDRDAERGQQRLAADAFPDSLLGAAIKGAWRLGRCAHGTILVHRRPPRVPPAAAGSEPGHTGIGAAPGVADTSGGRPRPDARRSRRHRTSPLPRVITMATALSLRLYAAPFRTAVRATARRALERVALARLRAQPKAVFIARLTATAVFAYLLTWFLPGTARSVLAPLTAVLVVQATAYQTVRSAFQRVVSVTAGVLVALAFSAAVGLTWWSLGLIIVAALLLGSALKLGEHMLEVPISAMLILSVDTGAAASGRIVDTLVGAGA